MTKAVFYTLGCKANQYQTEVLKSQLTANGLQPAAFGAEVDLYLINTCTVTEDADRKSRQAIRRALRLGKKVIVTGCYARLQGEKLKEIFPEITLTPFPLSLWERGIEEVRAVRVRSNLMIQDGCEHFCSYCIVPFARGKIASKPIDQVLSEANQMVEAGAREIVLTGINLGSYGKNAGTTFMVVQNIRTGTNPVPTLPEVIRELSKIEKLYRIRLSSLEPMYLTKELIDTVAQNPKVCHHLHIPLQSGDNEILRAMNRNYTRDDYLELVNYIRSKIPDCGITTDIIVGFPGEGEKEFQNTIDLINQIKFSRLHIFTYSKRSKTLAASFPNQVDTKTKKQRSKILHELKIKYMTEFASQYLGKEVEILVERKGEGLTSNYLRILYPGKESEVGSLRKVKFKIPKFFDNQP